MDEKDLSPEDLAAYVELAMKNLFFIKLQRDNVTSEFKRLLKTKDLDEVKKLLNEK